MRVTVSFRGRGECQRYRGEGEFGKLGNAQRNMSVIDGKQHYIGEGDARRVLFY